MGAEFILKQRCIQFFQMPGIPIIDQHLATVLALDILKDGRQRVRIIPIRFSIRSGGQFLNRGDFCCSVLSNRTSLGFSKQATVGVSPIPR
jgi:hypothetical protein